MCDFHSIVVRVDGAIAHVPSNSHSEAVKHAGWTENGPNKRPRFIECEWGGEGEYPGAEKISRKQDGEELTNKQVKAIDAHYQRLAKAMSGDEDAIKSFVDPLYSDVIDKAVWRDGMNAKDICDILVRPDDINRDAAVNNGITSASGDASKLSASGAYSNLAASGAASNLAASGAYSNLAASGAYSNLAASGYASKLSASGYASNLAASGYASKLSASGYASINMAAGYNSKAKAGIDGAIALVWYDGKRPRIAVGYVGEDGIKAETWYAVVDGKLKETTV